MKPDEAMKLLNGIPHNTCQIGLTKHWHVLSNGDVKNQSACWLACWAWTGLGSEKARVESESVFNKIFPIDFSAFKKRVSHKVARDNRYRATYSGPDLDGKIDNA